MENKNQSRQVRPTRWIWWFGSAAIILGLALSGITVLGTNNEAQAQADAANQTATAFIGDLSESVSATGRLTSQQESAISIPNPGVVEAVHVQVGDLVHEGEVILQIETSDLEVAVERAEQNLALQEANLERLLEPASEADIASAEAAVASARANLDSLLNGPSETDIIVYESDLASQEASVASAAAAVNNTVDSVSDAQLASALGGDVE